MYLAFFPCAVPYGLRPSDLETYVLFAAAEYIVVTRDAAFLSETVVPYNSTRPLAVAELLQAAFHYRTQVIGTGPHGLMRVQGSDWSDSFCRCVPLRAGALPCNCSSCLLYSKVPGCVFNNSLWWDIYNSGESLLVAGQTAYALQRLAQALQLAGPAYAAFAANASSFAAQQVGGGTVGPEVRVCSPFCSLCAGGRAPRIRASVWRPLAAALVAPRPAPARIPGGRLYRDHAAAVACSRGGLQHIN